MPPAPPRPYLRLWIGLGVLAGLVAAALGLLVLLSNQRLNRSYDIPLPDVSIPADPASIEHGRHLVADLAGCTDCHGTDLGGRVLYDDPYLGQIAASNLTAGKGGVGASYTDTDWIRAIRHGVSPDGKPLIFVMSSFFNNFGLEDLGAMIAYLQRVPPVGRTLPPTRPGILSRALIMMDPSLLPAQVIDHERVPPALPPPGPTAAYGRYLAVVACTICHGENFAGGLSVGAGVNLTPAGDLADWTEADFLRALRTGFTPTGDRLDPELMPWRRVGRLSDEELRAIWLHLQSLPATQSLEQ